MNHFEQRHVHEFYEESGEEFSSTRYRMWPKIEGFYQKYVRETDLLLDAGSGNGRNTLFPKRTVSMDYSRALLGIAETVQKGLAHVRHDIATPWPLKTGLFDIIISIAVIHHLSSDERRRSSIHHLIGALKPRGYFLLYVWSSSPEGKPEKFLSIKSIIDSSPITSAPALLSDNDVFVGWKRENKLDRYYHLFSEGELEGLLPENTKVIEAGSDRGNYFVIGQKYFSSDE